MSDKTSDKRLLSCPFCGGEAKLRKKNRIIVEGKTERECHVYCTKCNARAERVLYKNCDSTEMAHELARKLWNTRKPVDDVVEALEERLEGQHKLYAIAFDPENGGGYDAYSDAIRIVKEIMND